MTITDTHAHLYYPELLDNLDEILSRAKDKGIEKIIVPAVDLETSRQIVSLSEKKDMIYCALGVHPCEAAKNELKSIDEIEKMLSCEKIVAVGETGLDYYWDTSSKEKQIEFFRLQIELAKTYELPVVIHTRNSVDDALRIVRENYSEKLKGQFHCFSGSRNQLSEVLGFENFYVSFCGNITYKNFSDTEIVLDCPAERMLTETDSPFLPPVPFRGKKNEPSYIVHTIEKISMIKNTDYNNLLETINSNVGRLFSKL